MIKMPKTKKLLIGFVAAVMGIAAVFYCAETLTPKKFSDFFKGPLTACSVSHLDNGTLHLSGEQCAELMARLENAEFFSEGHSGRVLPGTLYHLSLWGTGGGKDAVLEMSVSDKGPIYIGRKRYCIKTTGEPLAAFLQEMYEKQLK